MITGLGIIIVILIIVVILLGIKVKALGGTATVEEEHLEESIKSTVIKLANTTIDDLVSTGLVKFKEDEKSVFIDNLVDSVVFSLSSAVKDDIKKLLSVTDYEQLKSVVHSIIESNFNLDEVFGKVKVQPKKVEEKAPEVKAEAPVAKPIVKDIKPVVKETIKPLLKDTTKVVEEKPAEKVEKPAETNTKPETTNISKDLEKITSQE